ncbi:MAG TPA: hypothetical protein VNK67_11365, partial [Burkholderiales bacterium]|nr:hypothetical protein [Burkholderiales bacterium]
INHGNLTLSGLSFSGTSAAIYASTQFGAPSGTLSLGSGVAVSGNLSLLSDTGMTIDKNVTATGTLALGGGGGTLAVVPGAGATTVQSGGAMALAGANVALGSASQTSNLDIVAGGGMAIGTGNLTVTGGNGGYTFVRTSAGNMAIVTTGNVTATGGSAGGFAHVLGSPDLFMTVGGTVQMNATDPTAPARIESAAPTTINLNFPNLASGGYFVNGQEGVVADPALGTGFYADGQPAVLGVNLIVAYGTGGTTTTPPVEQAINQVIASTNQQTTIAETETAAGAGTGTAPEEDDKKKKELPVCR